MVTGGRGTAWVLSRAEGGDADRGYCITGRLPAHRSTSQTTINPFLLPAAARIPSGAKATHATGPTSQSKAADCCQEDGSHNVTVASLRVTARNRPSGAKATLEK